MTYTELKEVLEETQYQVYYRNVSKENAPALPFIVYFFNYSNNFTADNKVYMAVDHIQVELYTRNKNETAENKVEQVLNKYELPYRKEETYIDDEKVYQVVYEIEINR